MWLVRLPGVYPPQADTVLLAESLARERNCDGAELLDVGTGSGAIAVTAVRLGARVTAVDVSRLALATAWINATLHRCRIRLRHGDLMVPVHGHRYDLIVSNPPYVPAERLRPPQRGAARAWDAGPDGRLLLDRICAQAPAQLVPGGVLLIVQSSLAGIPATIAALERSGLETGIVARQWQRFGRVMSARADWFERRGLIRAGVREEELVVIRGVRQP
ncbi:HemK2/MTQ2 family protein methyltransferase [Kitasatospora sp. HPMI-4]|uniref:HemK2/MTQ2 family protein methyltransferase n=1 Tax=Kitasatospora sp. HPMI-4 TaxID=3448443 RepID=UPI003F1ACDAF